MNWWMLAIATAASLTAFLLFVLVERRSRRCFRAEMADNARARWDIVVSMPPGETRDRLTLLHTRIAEITDRLWDDGHAPGWWR